MFYTIFAHRGKTLNNEIQTVYPYFHQSTIVNIQGKTTLSTLEKESGGMSMKQQIVKCEFKVHISVLHVKMIAIVIMHH